MLHGLLNGVLHNVVGHVRWPQNPGPPQSSKLLLDCILVVLRHLLKAVVGGGSGRLLVLSYHNQAVALTTGGPEY